MDVTLVAVAAVAGLATFLSPCVLPVLPVVAAASTTGGRRRPLGIAIGLAVAFVVFTLAASRAPLGARPAPGPAPQPGDRTACRRRRLAPRPGRRASGSAGRSGRLHPMSAGGWRRGTGSGRGSGSAAGLALVWTPCAGPILAAVSALSAQHRISLELVAITTAYAAGATVPIFVLALLGQRAVRRARARPQRRRRGAAALGRRARGGGRGSSPPASPPISRRPHRGTSRPSSASSARTASPATCGT